MDRKVTPGLLYVVSLEDAVDTFLHATKDLQRPTFPMEGSSILMDFIFDGMISNFEYKETAVESYRDFLFSQDLPEPVEKALECAADLETLVEFGEHVFQILQENGMYSTDGELVGRYQNLLGCHTLVLSHSPDTHWWP